MKARLITPVGLTVKLGLGCLCPGLTQHHYTYREIAMGLDDPRAAWGRDSWSNVPADAWPATCDNCGAALDSSEDGWHSRRTAHVYNTASGKPEPGDLFWNNHYDPPHLIGICPNGSAWDIDGRSSNGPGWTRSGEPPNVTAQPSIWIQIEGPRGYHGFLQNGEWTADLEGRTYPVPVTK